jgi:hypothetical protein
VLLKLAFNKLLISMKKSKKNLNPVLEKMYELKEPEEIDKYIAYFVTTFGNGGHNRLNYNRWMKYEKGASGKIKDLAYSRLRELFCPFQDEIRRTPDGEKRSENWIKCMEKLQTN